MLEAAKDEDAANDQRMHTPSPWNKHLSDRQLSDTEQGTTAAFPEVTGDGAKPYLLSVTKDGKPYTYCRTASCRRQAPGPFNTCGQRELHCCLHCCDTNGGRHSRQCEAYTTDNPPPSDDPDEPGGTSAPHPVSDFSEIVINDNVRDNVLQSSTSGGAPARRMYGGFGPEPEGGNQDDVFIDDGVPDDDEVVANMTAGLAPPPPPMPPPPPPHDDDDVFVDDDDDVVDNDDDDFVYDDDDDVVDDDDNDDVVDNNDDDEVDSTTVAPTLSVTSSLGSSVVTSPHPDDGEVFIDDGDGDDIVDPDVLAAAAAAGRSISPYSQQYRHIVAAAAAARAAAAVAPDVIPPDDDSSDASASDTTPAATSADTTSPTVPSVIHVCDTAGCLRRPGSDPASFGTIGYHICCGSCAFSNGQTHTQACQAQSLTPAEYFAWRRSTVPAPAPPSSGNDRGDGRPSHHDDFLPGWHNYGSDARDASDSPTPTTMPASTPMPTPASAPLPTPTVFNELVFTPVFPPRVDGEFCRGCNICVGRGPLPNLTLTLCHCSCGHCEYGVNPGDETAQGGMCDFCNGYFIHVPQYNTYVNRCNCDCAGCYRGRERLGILYDDETWIDHQTTDGEDPDSVFSTL